MADLKVKLGRRIKDLRKAKGITQEMLAEMVNMDITSLSKIETGRNYPQSETLEKIAEALKLDIDKLFCFREKLSKDDYLNAINRNVMFIKNNDEKLKMLYEFSSLLV